MGLYSARKVFTDEKFQYILEVDFPLDSFQEYIRITEELVNKQIKVKIDDYRKFLENATEEEFYMRSDSYEDHIIREHIHQLYYNSIFISVFSFFEKKLFQLCKIAEKNQSIKLKDLSGQGIVRCEKYLKKVLLIDLKELNSEWSSIKNYNILRNLIVHFPTNEMELSDSKTNKIKAIEHLVITNRDDMLEFEINDKELLLDFIATISKYLRTVYYEKRR